ncbi:MAG: EAL domain-containing protein, partial [Bullifex sp.]|nr:EAL domain-containing protein [Bullifex sp.]
LSEYGISFSLDDYGTGYSNLSRLISLPFRIVKIDRSMTEMVFDERIHTVLKHTIKLLKDIGISVVIEGVETKEVFDQFVALGADYIQGYYFSRPIPENDFAEFIRLHSGT